MVERLIHLKKVLLNKEIERISRNKTNIKKTEINFENNEIYENKISLLILFCSIVNSRTFCKFSISV